LNISIFYDGVDYRVKAWYRIRKLIDKVISEEGKISGDLNFILTNDKALLRINRKFLKHNYFTDVISFGFGEDKIVSGEVYISVDTVKRNAKNYKVSYSNEFLRVIVHGTLHLCGYVDSTSEERKKMSNLEDYWIDRYKEI
jgi:probable rRNA maturation factor